MAVGIFPAHKDSNGDWRFGLMTSGGVEPVHYDIEEMKNGGMLEPRFRAVLAERELSPASGSGGERRQRR